MGGRGGRGGSGGEGQGHGGLNTRTGERGQEDGERCYGEKAENAGRGMFHMTGHGDGSDGPGGTDDSQSHNSDEQRRWT